MNIPLIYRTIRYLKFTQVFHQVKYRLMKPAYNVYVAPKGNIPQLIAGHIEKARCLDGGKFTFLNLEHQFAGWNFTDNGMLWAYNQNYFDWINQEGVTVEEGCEWIDKFIAEVKGGFPMDPYPIALRSINWVKFFCRHPECAIKERLDSLYSQVKLLEKKLEYHLLGNHLLEDAYALYINACFFSDENLYRKASKLLKAQLKEQILPDGAHYEQSPMYHCILLDRLLDCVNICQGARGMSQEVDLRCLSEYAERMLGHLESLVWADKIFPLLNDSAYGIAPTPGQIFDYAKRLGLEWVVIPMKESGYRKMTAGKFETIMDIGNITSTYQPGHTHADTFNYELRVDGKPIVVDTGISTYNKTQRRQLERSTVAHNCVSVDEKNSSEVWGGFRVGKRCHVVIKEESETAIEAFHDGFEKPCRRRFEMKEGGLSIEDWYEGDAVSYVHLAEGVNEECVKIEGNAKVEIMPWQYSTEYNRFHDGIVMEIHFKEHLRYTIQ